VYNISYLSARLWHSCC